MSAAPPPKVLATRPVRNGYGIMHLVFAGHDSDSSSMGGMEHAAPREASPSLPLPRPRAVILYNSVYGSTRAVAQSIADALRTGMDVETVEARGDLPLDTAHLDLLVVGGPTHHRRLSDRLDLCLDRLAPATGSAPVVAVFDTRERRPRFITGSAARWAAWRIRRLGYRLCEAPQSFFVHRPAEMAHGHVSLGPAPLDSGELDRARAWGERLLHGAERHLSGETRAAAEAGAGARAYPGR